MGEPTHQKAAAARAAARQDRSELRAALVTERAGYVQRGLTERVEYADAQIAALDQQPDEDDPEDVPAVDVTEVDTLRAENVELSAQNAELRSEVEHLRTITADVPPADPEAPAEESAKAEAPKGRQRRSAAAAAEPTED